MVKLALGWTSVNKKILGLEATLETVEHHNQGLSFNRKMVLDGFFQETSSVYLCIVLLVFLRYPFIISGEDSRTSLYF